MCVVRLHWGHLSERQHACLRLGGLLIYNQYVTLTHVPSLALISWLIVWGALPSLTIRCYEPPPIIELSPLLCLSQWARLLFTMAWTTVEPGRCKWCSPTRYCRQRTVALLNKSSAPFTVRCCEMLLSCDAHEIMHTHPLYLSFPRQVINGCTESMDSCSFLMQFKLERDSSKNVNATMLYSSFPCLLNWLLVLST